MTGTSTNGTGVSGKSDAGPGTGKAGVLGISANHAEVEGQGTSGPGVLGTSQTGVGLAGFSDTSNGVYGEGKGPDSNSSGVFGRSDNGIGIRGVSSNGVAGRFEGNVLITGNLTVQGATHNGVPVGTIVAFAGTTDKIPAGWMICEGAALDRAASVELFNMIGTSWGAPDGATFNIPDLRGMFMRGVDSGAGNDPDRATRPAHRPGGNTGDAIGTVQNDAVQQHSHDNDAHSHSYLDKWTPNDVNTDFTFDQLAAHWIASEDLRTTGSTKINITGVLNGRVASETRVKNVGVYYIIRVR